MANRVCVYSNVPPINICCQVGVGLKESHFPVLLKFCKCCFFQHELPCVDELVHFGGQFVVPWVGHVFLE